MAELKILKISSILVPERLRAIEEEHALAISASIVEHGLINPITVRATPRAKRPWTLVTGAHRLRAVELTDDDQIEAMVVAADAAEARLQEITENLFRNELSALDRAVFVLTYREVWEEKHGKIARGRPGNSVNLTELIAEEGQRGGFAAHVAERLGLSASAVERAQFIGRSIVPELRQRLRGTAEADNQSMLQRLARMQPDEQRAVAQRHADGVDLKAAVKPAATAPEEPKSAQDKLFDTLVATWNRADDATRRRFLTQVGAARAPRERMPKLGELIAAADAAEAGGAS